MKEAPDVITDMLKVYSFDAYALLDLGTNLSFVTPFLDNGFYAFPEILMSLLRCGLT